MATTKKNKLCPAPWLDVVAQAAGSAVSSGIQALTQPSLRQQRESKQKYDSWYQENVTEKNMALQNDYQIAAEERQHEYDSPAAQVARLKAAGISPLALDGGAGAGVQGSVSSAPSASGGGSFSPSPMAIRPDLSGIADTLIKSRQQKKTVDAQVDNIKADTDLKLKQAGYSEEQRKRMLWENENLLPEQLKGIKFDNLSKEQQAKIMTIQAYIAEMTQENDIMNKQLLNSKIMEEIENLKQDREFSKKNAKYIEAKEKEIRELLQPRKENIEERTKDIKDTREARVTNLFAAASQARSQSDLNEQEYDFLDWFNQFKKDNSEIDKWFERGLTASQIADNLVSAYYKYKAHGDNKEAAEQKNRLEYYKLGLFVLRLFL